jgi:predicted metal-dependent enzyme (double-stranded beta helix superfamily)
MTGGEFFVDHPTLHGFIAAATGIVRGNADVATKLSQLRAPYKALLSDPDWLPEELKQPSGNTTMAHGIASLLLYRSELKDLSLSTLSEPSVSLHLLANDIGCVVRQKFDPDSGRAEPFRSGWSNAPCEER